MSHPAVYPPQPNTPQSVPGRFVSEAEYWEKYYPAETLYEWNNGRLEEKPVSDFATSQVYLWFVGLLKAYLETYPIAQAVVLDMGFRLALPGKTVIRRPDLGVVRNDNPATPQPLDCSYRGVFDICVEALSDREPGGTKRDMIMKKGEYAAGGVTEYFILHHSKRYQAFYFLDSGQHYQPIPALDGIIRSRVLPGFQFRVADLSKCPGLEQMRNDPVYQAFLLPAWRLAEQRAEMEAQARCAAEAEIQRLKAELARLAALVAEN